MILLGFLPSLVYLNVGLSQCDHLGQDLCHVQIVHLKPLPRASMESVDPVLTLALPWVQNPNEATEAPFTCISIQNIQNTEFLLK